MPNALYSSTITTSTGTVELGTRGASNNSVVCALSGTHSGFSVNFEGTNDGTVWFKLPCIRLATGKLEVGAVALSDNLTTAFQLSPGVFGKVRVRASARTSGTLAVTLSASPSLDPVVGTRLSRTNTGKKTALVPAYSAAPANTVITTGPGILHKIVVTTAGTTAGVIIYDNATTNSGTILYGSAATHAIGVYDINMAFVNGLVSRSAATTAAYTAIYSNS